jgi:tetratricopeptide (TPR) repeat protein
MPELKRNRLRNPRSRACGLHPGFGFLCATLAAALSASGQPAAAQSKSTPSSTRVDQETKTVDAATADLQAAIERGRDLALEGRTEDALRVIRSAIASCEQMLKTKPDDVETRILLATAYRDTSEFRDAIRVLEEGKQLKADPKFDFELSMSYLLMALHMQRNVPHSLDQQYGALRLGYVAYPPSPFIAGRYLQGILGANDDAAAARASLKQLIETPSVKGEPARGMAVFLLGIDAQRRGLAADARHYFDDARSITDEKIPDAVANLALAALKGRTEMIHVATGSKLTGDALAIWPENPNLQMVRGWNELRKGSFATALTWLNKAVKSRPDDPVLHSMLYDTYRGLGQTEAADKHRKLAEAAKAREQAAASTTTAAPNSAAAPANR